jgi:hypothetical protein
VAFRAGKPTKAGVFGRQDPIGWSRLYAHLKRQAAMEGAKANPGTPGDTDDAAQRRWAAAALVTLAGVDSQASPERISYDDAVHLLQASKAIAKPFVDFDAALDGTTYETEVAGLKALFPAGARDYWWSPLARERAGFGARDGAGRREPATGRSVSAADALAQYAMLSQPRRLAALRREITVLRADLDALETDTSRGPRVIESAAVIVAQIERLMSEEPVNLADAELATLLRRNSMRADPALRAAHDALERESRARVDDYLASKLAGPDLASARNRLNGDLKQEIILFPPDLWRILNFAEGHSEIHGYIASEANQVGRAYDDDMVLIRAPRGHFEYAMAFQTGARATEVAQLLFVYLHELLHTVGTLVTMRRQKSFVEGFTDVVAFEVRQSIPNLAPPDDPANPYAYFVEAPRVQEALGRLPPARREAIIRSFLIDTPADMLLDQLNEDLPPEHRLDFDTLDR